MSSPSWFGHACAHVDTMSQESWLAVMVVAALVVLWIDRRLAR